MYGITREERLAFDLDRSQTDTLHVKRQKNSERQTRLGRELLQILGTSPEA